MAGGLEDFVAKIRTDKALREKVFYAEADAANALNTLKKLAAAEGIDLSAATPKATESPTPTTTELSNYCGIVVATCCFTFTSTYIVEEAFSS